MSAKNRHPELKGDRCPRCNGSGNVMLDAGGFFVEASCPDCRGTGLVNSPNACKKCKGSGSIYVTIGKNLKAEATCDHCNGSGLEPAKK